MLKMTNINFKPATPRVHPAQWMRRRTRAQLENTPRPRARARPNTKSTAASNSSSCSKACISATPTDTVISGGMLSPGISIAVFATSSRVIVKSGVRHPRCLACSLRRRGSAEAVDCPAPRPRPGRLYPSTTVRSCRHRESGATTSLLPWWSLKASPRNVARETQLRVRVVRWRTVANVDSIGLVVRICAK